jgi:hypothetical protein
VIIIEHDNRRDIINAERVVAFWEK